MRIILGAMLACAGAAEAAPTSYAWQWNGGGGTNMNGGQMTSISAAFNSDTQRFSWSVTYADQVTDGYTLAVNDGPNPKGVVGELGLLYFDATDTNDVKVSVFEYNGQNNSSSHSNPGNLIVSSMSDANFVVDASVVDSNGSRTFNLEIDTSVVNSFPSATLDPEWHGIGFDDKIGVWFHSFRNLTTGYNNGNLNSWSGQQGWLDMSNQNATPVPLPTGGLLALSGLGLIAAGRRRAS